MAVRMQASPFDLDTIRGRRKALKYLRRNLPRPVFVQVVMWMLGEFYAVHPIQGVLVQESTLRVNRQIFCHMFQCENPSDYGHFRFGKTVGAELSRCFCRKCGETLTRRGRKSMQPGLTCLHANCRHGVNVVVALPLNQHMGGICYNCLMKTDSYRL